VSSESDNPLPAVADIRDTDAMDANAGDNLNRFTAAGTAGIGHSVFVLLAGARHASQMGFSGIDVSIPSSPATSESFLQAHISRILAMQTMAREKGIRERLPLIIMTSRDNHAETLDYLAQNRNFGMKGVSVVDALKDYVVVHRGKRIIVDQEAYRREGKLKKGVTSDHCCQAGTRFADGGPGRPLYS